MQVTLYQVLIDVYPKAHAQSDRSTWMRYSNTNPIAAWFRNHLSEQFLTLLGNAEGKKCQFAEFFRSELTSRIYKLFVLYELKTVKISFIFAPNKYVSNLQIILCNFNITGQTTRTRLERCWPQLIGFFVVLRVHDLTIQCVSDMNTKKDALTNLFESERHLHSLPSDQQIVHVEFGAFYHPHSDKLPVPNSAVYFQLGPFTISFDERTMRWCCYVAHALSSAIVSFQG